MPIPDDVLVTPHEAAAARRKEFADGATRLAERVIAAPALTHDPGVRFSDTLVLRSSEDDEQLVVLVGEGEAPAQIDAALAYGLVYQGDRDLHLILPDENRQVRGLGVIPTWEPAAHRLAHVATPVRLWSHAGDAVTERRIATKAEALAACRHDDKIRTDRHRLGDTEPLMREVVVWADERFDPAHRESYLSWHDHGRQVLKVRRSGNAVQITAGVDYSEPGDGQLPAEKLTITDTMTPNQVALIQAAVVGAAEARQQGTDVANLEHQLQARLAEPDGVTALGLVGTVEREVPASRPGQRRAYIDLLGVDAKGHVHVVETKIGSDVMLALQGLDYWVWANAYLSELGEHLKVKGHAVAARPRIFLDFVVGTKEDTGGEADLRYFSGPAEALDGAVSWRLGVVSGWRDGKDLHVDWRTRGA